MSTCKDCIHVEVCEHYANTLNQRLARYCDIQIPFEKEKVHSEPCEYFKNKSQCIELPELEYYTEVTTLDEAIDHAYKIAMSPDDNICVECKAEHMRLCGWLGELKRRIEAEQS